MVPIQTPLVPIRQELERLGLAKGNPFATLQADEERAFLDELFVDIHHFERIRSARTVIVNAPRGCGKSAARVRLANLSAPWIDRSDIDTFAVEFLEFNELATCALRDKMPAVTDYVDTILRQGAKTIFPFLFAPHPSIPRIERLTKPDLARLGKLLWQFAPDILRDSGYEQIQLLLPETVISWEDFHTAMSQRQVGAFLAGTASDHLQAATALAFVFDLDPEDRTWLPPEPVDRLNLFVRIVQAMGFSRLMVLVDKIDEMQATTSNYPLQADLLEPLLANLPLMEMPGVSFKFFIPTETRDLLLQRKSARTDRLDILNVTLDWDKNRLGDLLQLRLEYFTGLPDLSQFVSARKEDRPGDIENLSEAIENELIAVANHSPRRLIQAGQKLLEAYAARPNADLITWEDWLTAKRDLTGEDVPQPQQLDNPTEEQTDQESKAPEKHPKLYVSKRRPFMWIKGKEITLSDIEARIMQAVIAHDGTISGDELSYAVWNDAVNETTIDVNLGRIRKEIDNVLGAKKTGLTYYLIKKAGMVMLYNYEVCENDPPKEAFQEKN